MVENYSKKQKPIILSNLSGLGTTLEDLRKTDNGFVEKEISSISFLPTKRTESMTSNMSSNSPSTSPSELAHSAKNALKEKHRTSYDRRRTAGKRKRKSKKT